MRSCQLKSIRFSSVSSTETEHFQAPFHVIIFGSTHIENNQIEKLSTKQLIAWLLSKLHVIRQLKCVLKMIIQTERFRESSCKYLKTLNLCIKYLKTLHIVDFGSFYRIQIKDDIRSRKLLLCSDMKLLARNLLPMQNSKLD